MYIFCLVKEGTEEAAAVAAFAADIQREDNAARLELKTDEGFVCLWAYSKELGGYLSNGFKPVLRLHRIGHQDGYFELPLACINTLYEL